MKNVIVPFLGLSLFACSKKDAVEAKPSSEYQLRVAAIDKNGAKSYTSISRVRSGKVAVEFETDEATDIKEYDVEVSGDGITFRNIKAIAADLKETNKLYRDTVLLQ